jgi:hypothetical protein
MDIGKVFPSRYLKVADLKGKDVTAMIKEVKLEAVGKGQDSKPVAYFKGTDKGLVLNITNSKRIAAIAGSEDTDDWTGHKVTLYPTETEFQGDVVECIRVRLPKYSKPDPVKKPVKAKKVQEPEPDDPIPEPPSDVDVSADHDELDADEDPFDGV